MRRQLKDLKSNLQLVVLDCPYRTFSQQQTQDLFSKYVALKLEGYLKEYPQGTLPLGSYDFVGTIILLCEKKEDLLNPICCFKSTTQQSAKYFNLPFELLPVFHSKEEENHKNAVIEILKQAETQNHTVGYNSSWTIHPSWRKELLKRKIAIDLSLAIFTSYYQYSGIQEILIGGMERFGVDKTQLFLGFENLSYKGQELPSIHAQFLAEEKSRIMYLKNFSQSALKLAEEHQDIWNSRIVIESNPSLNQQIAA